MINPLASFISFLKDNSPNYNKLNRNLDDFNSKINELIGAVNDVGIQSLDSDLGNITGNGKKYLELLFTQLYNQHYLC